MPTRTQPSTLLSAIAHVLDAAGDGADGDALVLLSHVRGDPTKVGLTIRPLVSGRHPCEELQDLVAPPECWGVALVVHGRAHVLDAVDGPPEPVLTTYLRHRDGRQLSLLRRAGRVTEQRGPVEGRLPELCRRILASPGSSTSADP